MARRPRRKRRFHGNYLPGNIDIDLELGATLAANTVILVATQTVTETARVTSVKCMYSLGNWTPAAGEGPIMVGVAHSDYSLAEIEAWIEQVNTWSQGDLVAKEISSRLIRRIGVFDAPTLHEVTTLNDGKPIRTKLNWMLTTGQGLNFFGYNMGVTLTGTSPNLDIQGKANLWPSG